MGGCGCLVGSAWGYTNAHKHKVHKSKGAAAPPPFTHARTLLLPNNRLISNLRGGSKGGEEEGRKRGTQPPLAACKMEAQSERVHVACTRFCTFGHRFCMLQSVLSNKISASDIRRKFIESALLVG